MAARARQLLELLEYTKAWLTLACASVNEIDVDKINTDEKLSVVYECVGYVNRSMTFDELI